MEPETINPQQNPPPSGGMSTISTVKAVILLAVILLAVGFMYALRTIRSDQGPAQTVAQVQILEEIKGMSDLIHQAEGDKDIVRALNVFRDIAINEQNSPADRARALNAINYMYTATDYDAKDVYDVVFSRPPYAQYYTPSGVTEPDPLHPASTGDVKGVEAALVKLNEISFALSPTHYAISRMEIANVFAFQRATAKSTPAVRAELAKQYTDNIKMLVASYDALPPLSSVDIYPRPMLLQIMFAHSSVLSFVGKMADGSYLARGEAGFLEAISTAQAFQRQPYNDDVSVLHSQELLARIFYASYFWGIYKPTNPEYIMEVIRPLMSETAGNTNVHVKLLPLHKDSKSAPYTVLRDIAKQMPEFKTYLEGRGWTF